MDEIRDCPGPDPDPRPPAMPMPPGACDTHAHVFDAARYPYQATRAYTPPDNGVDRLLALHDALGLSRGVVVQASVHGTDNRATLDAAAAHPGRLRAIVSVTEDVTEAEILRMHAQGARGIRVNLVDRGGMPFAAWMPVRWLGDAPLLACRAVVQSEEAWRSWPPGSAMRRPLIGHVVCQAARGGASIPGSRLLPAGDGLFG